MMEGHDEAHAPKSLEAMTLDEIIAHRSAHLTGYQSKRLAARYRKLVEEVRDAATNGGHGEAMPRAVNRPASVSADATDSPASSTNRDFGTAFRIAAHTSRHSSDSLPGWFRHPKVNGLPSFAASGNRVHRSPGRHE